MLPGAAKIHNARVRGFEACPPAAAGHGEDGARSPPFQAAAGRREGRTIESKPFGPTLWNRRVRWTGSPTSATARNAQPNGRDSCKSVRTPRIARFFPGTASSQRTSTSYSVRFAAHRFLYLTPPPPPPTPPSAEPEGPTRMDGPGVGSGDPPEVVVEVDFGTVRESAEVTPSVSPR